MRYSLSVAQRGFLGTVSGYRPYRGTLARSQGLGLVPIWQPASVKRLATRPVPRARYRAMVAVSLSGMLLSPKLARADLRM